MCMRVCVCVLFFVCQELWLLKSKGFPDLSLGLTGYFSEKEFIV